MLTRLKIAVRSLLVLAALALGACGGGGGGGGGDANWYYHFVCNGDSACLSTNFAGTSSGTSNQGPGQGGEAGCNGLMNFGRINWNIPPAQQWCDHSATIPPPPQPTVNISVAPTPINQGQSATVTWSSSNATSCTASNAWSGAKGLNGNTNVSPSSGGTYTYTLSCTGGGGTTTKSAVLTVDAPSIAISVSPSTIADGQSSMLTWSTQRTTACTASGNWSGSTALSGSQSVSPSTGTYTYTLTCTGTGGAMVSNSATLTVTASAGVPPPPTVTISISNSVLTWSTTRAAICTATGSWSGEDMPFSGNQTLSGLSPGTYTYTLSCSGSGGSGSGSATLNVPSSGQVLCSPPSANIAVTPSTIVEGESATLSWDAAKDPFCSSPSFSCQASGSWSGGVANSGTLGLAPSAGSFTYVLNCRGRNHSIVRSATLTVTAAASPPAPVVNLVVAPAAINLGEGAGLTWTTSYVRSCTASGAWSGAKVLNGTAGVAPVAAGTYDYTLTCLGSNASAAATSTLSVEQAAGTTATARFNNPYRLAVDSGNNIFVADTINHTIRKITPSNVVTTLAGFAGSPGSANGTGAAARFNTPYGIAIDDLDKLFVADTVNNTIRAVTQAGAVSTLAGLAGTSGSTDETSAAARFSNPFALAADSAGNIYVADTSNNIIRKVTPAGVVTTIAGTAGMTGSTDATGAAARFNSPQGIAVDSAGNIYVADSGNHTIRKIDTVFAVTTFAGLAGAENINDGNGSSARFSKPVGVAVDSADNVYVSDYNSSAIRKITPARDVTTFAGNPGNPGQSDGNGTSASFRLPTGLAADSADNIYVADSFNCTIRKITPARDVTTVAGQALACGSNN